MVESPASPTSAELIKERIDEKRLFEARFLFKKFSSEIDPPVRRQLRQQLENLIEQAGRIFARAEQLEEQGRYEEARQGYTGVFDIAIDFPAVDRALQRVTVALALGPLQPVSPAGEEDQAAPSLIMPQAEPEPQTFLQRRKLPLFFGVMGVLVLALFAVLGIFRAKNELPAQTENPVPRVVAATTESAEKSVALPVMPKAALQKEMQPESVEEAIVLSRAIEPPIVQDESKPVEKAQAPGPQAQVDSLQVETDEDSAEEIKGAAQMVEQPALVESDPETVVPDASSLPQPVSRKLPESSPIAPVDSEKSVSEPTVETENVETVPVEKAIAGPAGKEERMYTVRTGDTLESIADKVYGDRYKWSYLVQANREKLGRSPYTLSVGARLVVPSVDELANTDFAGSPLNSDGTYTVQSGDSLGSIAVKVYGSSRKWQQLYELNRDRLSSPSSLQVGQKLRIREEEGGGVDNDPVGE
jgi:nucleoid-associated protein YgaU